MKDNRQQDQTQMFPDLGLPLPRLGRPPRPAQQSPCVVTYCTDPGFIYQMSKSASAKQGCVLGLCDRHAKLAWELPLLDTPGEYATALRKADAAKAK